MRRLYRYSQTRPVMDFSDPSYKRLNYVRYADDWVIGLRGSLKEAKEILAKVTEFCTSIGLTVSETKTKITNMNRDRAFFLGVNIFRSRHTKYAAKNSASKQRLNAQLRFTASLDRTRKKLSQAGFMKNDEAAPRFLWLHLAHEQILHLYNSVFRGYMEYFSFVHNYGQLVSLLNHTLKTSCAKLLATKFKLRSTAKVFAKFGKTLKCKTKDVEFITPNYKSDNMRFKVNASPIIIPLFSSHKSTATMDKLACPKCGSTGRIEMHHVKWMKDLNPKISEIDRMMIKANRKQIPLCRKCHMERHQIN